MRPKYYSVLVTLVLMLLLSTGLAQAQAGVLPIPLIEWPTLPHITLPAPPAAAYPLLLPVIPGTRAVPMPGLRDRVIETEHAAEKHGIDAWYARRAAEDPRNRCNLYTCREESALRACMIEGSDLIAVQWMHYGPRGWGEGTAFLMEKGPFSWSKYLIKNGCQKYTGNLDRL